MSEKKAFSYFLGKFINGPFWTNLGHFYLKYQLYISCGFQLNWFILTNYVLIYPNFVFKLYLDSLEHKKLVLAVGKFIFGPFCFLGVPITLHFGCLNLYFDHFSYLSLLISHFNLKYIDLCKFKLFDEPLQHGIVNSYTVIYLYSYIVV